MELICTQLEKRYSHGLVNGLVNRYTHGLVNRAPTPDRAPAALRDVTLRCTPGILGLVGPNGAGKTTLIRMMATVLKPSKGAIHWNGMELRTHGQEIRSILGYLPQEFGFYPEFSGKQFLRYMASLKGLPKKLAQERVDEVLAMVHLEKVAERKIATYSGGMKQRLGIAQALINDPELLIVDEPTTGLDPEERIHFRRMLADLRTNRVIILSTHIISDIEAIADRLVILREGQILLDTTPEDLIKSASGCVWKVVTDQTTATRLQEQYQTSAAMNTREGVALRIVSPRRPHPSAVLHEPSLEDAYLFTVSRQREMRKV